MKYFLKNRRKLVKNEQKLLKNFHNVLLDLLNSPAGCLSTCRERLFGTISWYHLSTLQFQIIAVTMKSCDQVIQNLVNFKNCHLVAIPSTARSATLWWFCKLLLLSWLPNSLGTVKGQFLPFPSEHTPHLYYFLKDLLGSLVKHHSSCN